MAKNRILLCATLLACCAVAAIAADNAALRVKTADNRFVTLWQIGDNVVRVLNNESGTDYQSSAAVSTDYRHPEVVTIGQSKGFSTASGITAMVDTVTGAVTIGDGVPRIVGDNGVRSGGKIRLATMGRCSWYGGGERGHSLPLNGDTLVMYNRQNYGYVKGDPRIKQMGITMPLLISSEGYALLFDDFAAAKLVVGDDVLTYDTENPRAVAYYYIGGGSMPRTVQNLTALTGRQQLAPMWALGYITSKYGYRTQDETTGVIDTLKTGGYPVDGVVLDLYWYGREEDMGRLAWDPEQWPDHVKMLRDLKDRGVNTVIISQPYVLRNGRGVDNFNELSAKGLLVRDSVGGTQDVTIWVGEGGMFDMSNPETRTWLRNRYRQLTDEGVGGWWGDLGEPEVHPETGVHANGLSTRLYHNQYGNDWSSIIANLFREEYPDRRLMTMMRGGTTGLQRYNVFPWSTDVSRSWGGMQPQVTIMLNSGLSGLGYMSHDVGGFAIDEERPVDPELYVRWLQLGLFSPVLRTHAQRVAEPYHYKEYEHIILPLIKQRYAWLPYNYTLSYENASQGLPLVRPIGTYAAEPSLYDAIDDQYLWGRDIMVTPVLEQGATSRNVVFAEGEWLDLNNPATIFVEGDTIHYDAPIEVIPTFVRRGAFIASADYPMTNTGDYRTDRYTVRYFPFGKSEGFVYEDDMRSPGNLESGEFALLKFVGDDTESAINIKVTIEGAYADMPTDRKLDFQVFMPEGAPKAMKIAGKTFKKWRYDKATSMLKFTANMKQASEIAIVIDKMVK